MGEHGARVRAAQQRRRDVEAAAGLADRGEQLVGGLLGAGSLGLGGIHLGLEETDLVLLPVQGVLRLCVGIALGGDVRLCAVDRSLEARELGLDGRDEFGGGVDVGLGLGDLVPRDVDGADRH